MTEPLWRRYLHFVRPDAARDVDDELAFHLRQAEDDLVAGGLPRSDARRRARERFGHLGAVRDACLTIDRRGARRARRRAHLTGLGQDLRHAVRTLANRPAFTFATVVTLALGIGANTAIFSVVNAVLLHALPYRDAGRLVDMTDLLPSGQSLVLDADYFAWRRDNHTLVDAAAYGGGAGLTLTGVGEPERLRSARSTANFLAVLGVTPQRGRPFSADEDRPGGPAVVLMSDALWRRRFHGDPGLVGRTLTLNGEPRTVVGILPAAFEFPRGGRPDLITPFALDDGPLGAGRGSYIVQVVGRLRPGVGAADAEADIAALNRGLEPTHAGGFANMLEGARAQVVPLHARAVGDVRLPLLILLGAVGCVLLIACANAASLQLARAAARRGELAIRSALGAGRRRLARHVLLESLLLAAAGGLSGLGLAYAAVGAVRRLGPATVPHIAGTQVDPRVLAFAMILSLATALLFGLAPMLGSARVPPSEALHEGGARTGTGRRTLSLQQALLVAEVALALVLFVGAGLLMRSFLRLTSQPLGFDGRRVLTAAVALPPSAYATDERRRGFFRELVEQASGLPGVDAAGVSVVLPLQGFSASMGVEVEGRPAEPAGSSFGTAVNAVSPGYFAALGIPLLRGRSIAAGDDAATPAVLVANETFVRRFFPGEDPVGKRLRLAQQDYATIVGVVGDVRQGIATPAQPEVYAPFAQWPQSRMTLSLRAAGDPSPLADLVRTIVRNLDPDLPVTDVASMESLTSEQVAPQRFNTVLFATFALLAVLLAAVGIYGVTAYAVSLRVQEFGIRLAMGAEPGRVVRMVVMQGLRLAALGVVIGLAASVGLTRLLASQLYDTTVTDPPTFVAVTLILTAIALLACLVPAWRVTRVNPADVMRVG